MSEVGFLSFGNGVVISVNDAVEVLGDNFSDVVQFLEIVDAVADEGGESDGGQITDGDLVGGRVLDDFSAEVGRPDGTEVLLV